MLDPFMGSGTTLVEAQRLSHVSIGIDVNPVSCLLASSKTLTIASADVKRIIESIALRIAQSWPDISPASLPESVQHEKWYMPTTLHDLRKLWSVCGETTGHGKILAHACFSATLLPACREDRHWGYVCDNTMPKGMRAPSAKELFLVALQRIAVAYKERSGQMPAEIPEARVINGDAASKLSELPDNSVDCVVTSPPYFGVADYAKAQRLSMEWLSSAIEPVRRSEIGARSKRHRTTALNDYVKELDSVFVQVRRVLKKSSVLVIVFGQSPKRPDAYTLFLENLIKAGFEVRLERLRTIPVGRRQMPSLACEKVLVLQKV